MEDKYQIPAVKNAMSVLVFIKQHGPARLGHISRELKINKTSCYRILKTLESLHYLHFDSENNEFGVGYNLHLLSSSDLVNKYIAIVQPFLNEYSLIMESTVSILRRFSFEQLVYVAKNDENELQNTINVTLGRKVDIIRGAHGKVFMAAMDEEELDRAIAGLGGLKMITPNTITDRQQLKAELDNVRKHGFAINIEESLAGVSALAAPIYDHEDKLLFVMTCHILANQTNREDLMEKGKDIVKFTKRISKKIKESL